MIKENNLMKSHDDASLAILKLLGITKTTTRVEIIINGTDPILVNVSYFENEYLDGIVCGLGTITKTHVLVEKPSVSQEKDITSYYQDLHILHSISQNPHKIFLMPGLLN